MPFFNYNGTSGNDTIMTSDLSRLYPYEQNFSVDGLDGDDYIYSYIGFDRIGVDEIKGGTGNDYLVGRASLTPSASISFRGGTGADTVSFPDAEINEVISTSGGGLEMVIRNLSNGTLFSTFVGYDVEILSIEDENDVHSYYMTEDISLGEFRKVDRDEYNFGATGDNMDWYLNGLDTATAYQEFILSSQEPEPTPQPEPEPTPQPEPTPEPVPALIPEWEQQPIEEPETTPEPEPTPEPVPAELPDDAGQPEEPLTTRHIVSKEGKGKLIGSSYTDVFIFLDFDVFTKKNADKIIGFDSSDGDQIYVSPDAFPALQDAAEQRSDIKFASTNKKKELKLLGKQDYDFVYFEKKGKLYFDGNGTDKKWGDSSEGGLVAILKGKPELTQEDFYLLP